MFTRRQFLERTLQGSSLIALGAVVPGFLARTARAAEPGKDSILVVLEMTGGNDGLNTVAPYGDDLYHAARPTIRLTKEQVVRIDDYLGLNPGLRSLDRLLGNGQLAIVQGVGYPNPDRSHFESMDVWQSADPQRKVGSGWLGRGMGAVQVEPGHIPGIYVGTEQLPLAMQGSATGVPTIHYSKPYDLDLSFQARGTSPYVAPPFPGAGGAQPEGEPHLAARRQLVEDMAKLSPANNNMLQFVQRSALQTYTTIERLRQIMTANRQNYGYQPGYGGPYAQLGQNLTLIAQMIAAELGTRVFYVSLGGFDTHSNQLQDQQQALQQVGDGISNFFAQLERTGHARRVLLMTFSEFGRRVQENGSHGTDHGAASCLFVAGPAVKGGVIGKHPSLAREALDNGDLRHHTDFRQVYATLLDGWLGCDSERVLAGKFEHMPLLKQA